MLPNMLTENEGSVVFLPVFDRAAPKNHMRSLNGARLAWGSANIVRLWAATILVNTQAGSKYLSVMLVAASFPNYRLINIPHYYH